MSRRSKSNFSSFCWETWLFMCWERWLRVWTSFLTPQLPRSPRRNGPKSLKTIGLLLTRPKRPMTTTRPGEGNYIFILFWFIRRLVCTPCRCVSFPFRPLWAPGERVPGCGDKWGFRNIYLLNFNIFWLHIYFFRVSLSIPLLCLLSLTALGSLAN